VTAPRPRFDVERLAVLPSPLLAVLIAALAALVVFAALPQRPYILHVLQKLGHPGVFALIAIAGLALARRRQRSRPAWEGYALVVVGCALLGAATEIAQAFTHRDAALLDVGLDVRGALFALALAAACDRRLYQPRPVLIRVLALGLALTLAVLIAAPLATALAAYAHRSRNFPVLFAPAGPIDLYFVDTGSQSAELAVDSSDPATRTLRVALDVRQYAGIALNEPSPDWRGFGALRVDVTNPNAEALDFNVRVEDEAHDQSFADRYNGSFVIAARSRRVIEIPLASIEAAPHGRRLNLARVARVGLFRNGAAPDEFDLNGVALQ
jgi:VanZ family protein